MSEVIVLAGGFGSRLRSVVADRPKPLSEIAGRAFLEWQLDALIERGVSRIVLSVGYMADSIQTHFSDKYRGLEVVYCKEDEPLGTGGAIRLSLNSCKSEYPFVVNGDSFSWYPLDDLRANMASDVDAVMALLWVEQADRYAVVSFDEKSKQVVGFFSKGNAQTGYINSGAYCINRQRFLATTEIGRFSVESDYFEAGVNTKNFKAVSISSPFIDIGIPEDFERAQTYIPASFNRV
jgi:D-glycero-alpha-D-manno-heptose 1-phosphate guanylyltransferase